MLESLAVLLLFGYLAQRLAEFARLPGIVGMVAAGMVLGPYGFDRLHGDMLQISADLRSLALIVILLRAGLGLHRDTLNRVGPAALKLGSIPCVLEGLVVMAAAHWWLGLPWVTAAMLGFILAAVSPAVVVPAMLALKKRRRGGDKSIPTLILAGASLDDVIAITLFSAALGLAVGKGTGSIWVQLSVLPLNILLGAAGGVLAGLVLLWLYRKDSFDVRNTEKLVLLLAFAMLYYILGERLGWAGLLGVMAIGLVLLEYRPQTANQFSVKLNRIWVFAEILLFALVGAAVNLSVAWSAGLTGALLIAVGLAARTAGVWVATMGTTLDFGERWFCAVSYWPKATVQAAVGGVPLAAGLAHGDFILAVAVLAIIITAPLGAFAIQWSAPRLLSKSPGPGKG